MKVDVIFYIKAAKPQLSGPTVPLLIVPLWQLLLHRQTEKKSSWL
jgi:hypothetical protein